MRNHVKGLAIAFAALLVLSGCAPTSADFERAIPPAVIDSDPAIYDAVAHTSTGLAGIGVSVRIYVTSTEHDDLARAIEAALEAVLAASPARPVSIALDIGARPRSPNARPSIGFNNVSIAEVAKGLGLYDGFLSNDTISGGTDKFEERYGAWEDLHE